MNALMSHARLGDNWEEQEPPLLEYSAACLCRDAAALVEAWRVATRGEREAAWADIEAAYIELHSIVKAS